MIETGFMPKKRANIKISGEVQGVTFRWFIERTARNLGLTGWVKNHEDGSVEVVAEGEKEKLDQLIKACGRGPSWAQVADLESNWQRYKGEFEDFKIIF